jgi:hypothetical protein
MIVVDCTTMSGKLIQRGCSCHPEPRVADHEACVASQRSGLEGFLLLER